MKDNWDGWGRIMDKRQEFYLAILLQILDSLIFVEIMGLSLCLQAITLK